MYEMAKQAREKMKAKAKSLANPGNYAKDQRVDSSDWSPAEPLNAEAKTGLRPISQRQYKKGGKVDGKAPKSRPDRKARKSGGRTNMTETEVGVGMANKNMREANKSREGVKHIGGFKEGGNVPSDKETMTDKARLGTMKIKPSRGKAGHYKDGGGSWLEKMVGKPKTGSDMSQVGKMGTANYTQEQKGALNRAIEGNDALPAADEAAERSGKFQNYKKGGRAKKQVGGAMTPQMMPAASGANVSPAVSAAAAQSLQNLLNQPAGVPMGRKHGGKAEHPDVKEDKALVRKMVKKSALTGKKDGGETGEKWIQKAIKHKGALHKSLHVPEGEKIPAKKLEKAAHSKNPKLAKRARLAETLKRMHRADGGLIPDLAGDLGGHKKGHKKGAAKGKTNINIVIAAGQKPAQPPMPMAGPMMPPPGAGAPPPMPIPGGAPMARKAGGRITKIAKSYKDMEAGAGSGEGRLQKTDIAKLHKDAPARKSGGKVDFKSIKDGAKGKTHLAGIKVEHCVRVRGK